MCVLCCGARSPTEPRFFPGPSQWECCTSIQSPDGQPELEPARLVRHQPAGLALAAKPRPVCHLGGRDHAPADAGRDGDPVLPALDAPLPRRADVGSRRGAGDPARLGRAGVLRPRALRLHQAARWVVAEFGGELPRRRAELQILPGIGAYTASAIAAIAFGENEVALDGNLRRVSSRLLDFDGDPRSPAGERYLRQQVMAWIPDGQAGDFNQALMDLGTAICRPRWPDAGGVRCLASAPRSRRGLGRCARFGRNESRSPNGWRRRR